MSRRVLARMQGAVHGVVSALGVECEKWSERGVVRYWFKRLCKECAVL